MGDSHAYPGDMEVATAPERGRLPPQSGAPHELTPLGSEDSVTSTETVKLKRTMGLFSGVGMMAGTIIGSGIFVSPKGVLMESGSVGLSLVIWAACGVITLLGSLSLAELGSFITKSGGIYNYIDEAFGGFAAFIYLWAALLIIFPAANAAIAITFANYAMYPFFPHCEPPWAANRLLAALAIILLTYVNASSVKWATRVQNVFAIVKVLALTLIIGAGVVLLCMGRVDNFQNAFENSTKDPGRIAMAFYSGLFSYSGWYTLNFVVEELKNPYKNLGRAIWISIPMVTFIYVMANVAYFTILEPAAIISSDAVAVTFVDRIFSILSVIMPVFVAFSTFGSLNGCILSISRLFFVGARQGHLPEVLALINTKNFTPVPSIVFECVISCLFLFSDDVFQLINYVSFVEALSFALCIAGLFVLRKTRPDVKRPIKVNLVVPVIFFVICVFLLVVPLYTSPGDSVVGLVICASGVPVYWIAICWKNKPKAFTNLVSRATQLAQKLTMTAHQEGKID